MPPHTVLLADGQSGSPAGKDAGANLDEDEILSTLEAAAALVGMAARSMAPTFATGLTLMQFRALLVTHRAGTLRPAELSDELGMARSGVTRLVDRLESAGLLRREPSTIDRREVQLAVTEDGAGTVRQVLERRRIEITRTLQALTPAERRAVSEGMRLFAGAAQHHAGQAALLGW